MLRVVGALCLMLLATAAHADIKTLLGLSFTCAAGSSELSKPQIGQIPDGGYPRLRYYSFSGSVQLKPYTLCQSAGGAWGEARHGSAAGNLGENCMHFGIAAFRLMC